MEHGSPQRPFAAPPSCGDAAPVPLNPTPASTDASVRAPALRPSWIRRLVGPPIRIILYCSVTVLATESIARNSLVTPFQWVWSHPIEAGLNVGTILALLLIGWLLLGRLRLGAILAIAVAFFVALGSAIKGQTLGEPLFPWEIFLAKQVTHLPGLFTDAASLTVWECAALSILLGVCAWSVIKLPKGRAKLRYRLVPGLAAAALPYAMVFHSDTTLRNWYRLLPWDQPENYRTNGQLVAFASNTRLCFVKRPPDYSARRIAALAETLRARTAASDALPTGTNGDPPIASSQTSALRPNLIVVMSEAFWDPTLLPGVKISPDPLAKLRARSPGGKLQTAVSPSFGGQTSNVEFEFLTGLSLTPLPAGSNPYQQYVMHEIPSLAGLLGQRGYDAVAIHPYYKWYWNRDRVYPLLGFSRFIGEEDLVEPQRKSSYVTDASLMRDIASILNQAKSETFVFAVTMQNHWPYLAGAYPDEPLSIQADMLEEEDRDLLLRYSQGAHESVAALEWLIVDLEKRERPSVLVFFGDHLPVLGNRFGVYRATGFLDPATESLTPVEHYRIRQVPILIYDTRRGAIAVPELSVKFLGPRLLTLLGEPLPPFHSFLNDLSHQWPVLTGMFQIDGTGQFNPRQPDEQGEWLREYRLLQYDLLFGGQYCRDSLF